MRSFSRLAGVSVLLLATSVVTAGGLPKEFTLAKYVPGDAWFYMDFADNPENAWLCEEWAEVLDALQQSGVQGDLISLVMSLVSQDDRDSVQASVDEMTNLLKKVGWADLVAQETSFAMRMAKLPVPYDYMVLMRGKPGSGEANLAALTAIAKEIASWSPEHISVAESKVSGVQLLRLGAVIDDHADDMAKRFGELGVHLFGKGDLIGLVFGSRSVADGILARINGENTGSSMHDQKRLAEALTHVPAPEDGLVFVDIQSLLGGFSDLIDEAVKMKHNGPDAEDKAIVKTILRVFDFVDVFEYSVATLETVDRKQLSHAVAKIHSEKMDSPVCKMFLDRKPFTKFDQYLPANATSFLASGLIGLEQLYDTVIDFIKTEIPDSDDADDRPDGEEMIEFWNQSLAGFGFDPKEDLFSWFSGEIVMVSMPPAVVTPMSSSDSVLMIRVSDSAKAKTKVDAAIQWVNAMMQGHGQGLMITEAPVEAEGFKEIVHPMLAMFLRPVVGVHDEWLMIGSSAASVNSCLAVASGKSPSIKKNDRFKREGLCCDKPMHSVSFTDTSKFGEELAGAVGMIGMFGGMVTAQIPDEDGKKAAQSIMGILMKLAPVLQKLDFFSSEASMTTIEKNLVRTETVITYKSAQQLKAQSTKSVASQN